MGFKELFYPGGVAVFGSVAPGKLGGNIIDRIIIGGRTERLYAVNPKGLGRENIPGYAHIGDIPDTVDLAVIAAPAATVPGIMEECGQKGVKAAIVISSGFSEAGNKEGEEEIKRIAKKYDICFIGPNCAGLVNTHSDLAPTLQAIPPKGYTAVISQSGAVGGAIMEWAQLHGLGISKFASYGNGADLNQVEFLRYLKTDDETKVVAIYIENVNDGRAFMDALKDLAAVKPVVALKSGRTSSGQRAAMSHTGSMAGSDSVYDAAFAACGAIRVDSLDELIDLCKGFSYLPPVKGRKVAIVTNSGGPGVMTADLAEQIGMDACEPSEELIAELKTFLPGWSGFKNPIDMTVEGTGPNYQKTIEVCLKEFDAALPIFFGPPYLDTTPIAEGILAAFRNSGKPVAVAMETGLNAARSVAFMRDNALPNFPSTERAIKVLRNMARYEEYKAKLASDPAPALADVKDTTVKSPLLEPDAMELLRSNGVNTPKFKFVSDRAAVAAACEEVGYPVVMKVVSPKIIHKSDFGGVKLNITCGAEAEKAFDEIEVRARDYDFRGVVIYPMIKGGREVILGLTRDRQFGPVVAFGLGGIYTEVLKDIQLRIAPVSKDQALEMIKGIKSYKILQGIRGQAPADIDKLAEMISKFSQLPFQYPNLKEADLNPVFVFEDDAQVGDVRLIFE